MNGKATRGMPAENGAWAAIDEIVEFLAVVVVLAMLFGSLWFAFCGAVGYTMGRMMTPIDTDETELESL